MCGYHLIWIALQHFAPKGLRITVGIIIGLIASGHSHAEILKLYRYLEEEDIPEGPGLCCLARYGN